MESLQTAFRGESGTVGNSLLSSSSLTLNPYKRTFFLSNILRYENDMNKARKNCLSTDTKLISLQETISLVIKNIVVTVGGKIIRALAIFL